MLSFILPDHKDDYFQLLNEMFLNHEQKKLHIANKKATEYVICGILPILSMNEKCHS